MTPNDQNEIITHAAYIRRLRTRRWQITNVASRINAVILAQVMRRNKINKDFV